MHEKQELEFKIPRPDWYVPGTHKLQLLTMCIPEPV